MVFETQYLINFLKFSFFPKKLKVYKVHKSSCCLCDKIVVWLFNCRRFKPWTQWKSMWFNLSSSVFFRPTSTLSDYSVSPSLIALSIFFKSRSLFFSKWWNSDHWDLQVRIKKSTQFQYFKNPYKIGDWLKNNYLYLGVFMKSSIANHILHWKETFDCLWNSC